MFIFIISHSVNWEPKSYSLSCWVKWQWLQGKLMTTWLHSQQPNHLTTNTVILQPLCGSLDFVRNNLGEPVPEETFTHSHLSWSSIIPYLLPPSFTIHDIQPVQFTYLIVFFHNLCPSILWSTAWPGTLNFILYAFLHPVIVFFLQHVPIPLQPVLL